MRFRANWARVGLWAALALVGSSAAKAAPIGGVFNITGSVQVQLNVFDWFPVGGGTGTFTVVPPTTGYFAALTGTGTIQDLTAPEATAGNPVANFLSGFTAPGFGSLAFTDALFIAQAGSAGNCTGAGIANGQSCTVGNTLLQQTSNGVTSTIIFSGNLVNGADGPTGATANFSTQLNGFTVASLIAVLAPGGNIQTSYSASISSVPEPATFVLMGSAFAALALIRRRRRG